MERHRALGQTNTPELGYNSFFCYTKWASFGGLDYLCVTSCLLLLERTGNVAVNFENKPYHLLPMISSNTSYNVTISTWGKNKNVGMYM